MNQYFDETRYRPQKSVGKLKRLSKTTLALPLIAALAVLSTGTVLALSVLGGDDTATFESSLDANWSERTHLLKVDGSGELTATADATTETGNEAALHLELLAEDGQALKNVKATSDTSQLIQTVDKGVYTLKVSSMETPPAEPIRYTLSVKYPSGTFAFGTDTPESEEVLEVAKETKGQTGEETRPARDPQGPQAETLETGSTVANTMPSDSNSPTGGSMPATERPENAAAFFDFTEPNWEDDIEFDVFHRDDNLVKQTEWLGDHAPVEGGVEDNCGPPGFKAELQPDEPVSKFYRTIQRGQRSEDFNDEWIYRCAPLNRVDLAHIMTTIGDTAGYSQGAFTPKETFNNVREIRWDVNNTDLGGRQWVEASIIPADNFSFERLPCIPGQASCPLPSHQELEAVGISWGPNASRKVVTPEMPRGYTQAGGALGYRCDGCAYVPSIKLYDGIASQDKGVRSDMKPRRTNFFRDNGDGTLTWGVEHCVSDVCDFGTPDMEMEFAEFTVPGSFPEGPVKVVFSDHNYTPLKSDARATPIDPDTGQPQMTFTWHWDDIAVFES